MPAVHNFYFAKPLILHPLVQFVGQGGSEVTGPAFSSDGRFFYFSSQRGPGADAQIGTAGMPYCIEGPWFTPLAASTAST